MKKNIAVAVVGLSLAAALVPKPANAACSTGAFNICASVTASTYTKVDTTYKANGQIKSITTNNHVVLKVVNLGGPGGTGQSHVMLAVGFNAAGVTTGELFGAWYTSGAVGSGQNVFGNGSGKWSNQPSNVNNAVGASVSDALGNASSGGLIGCNEAPHDAGLYATCTGGTVMLLDFSIGTQTWNQQQGFAFGWHSGTANGLVGCSLWVAGDGTTVGADAAQCQTVVPEPITMVLLGSGLAGLGGAGVIRRRKQNGDVVNG